MLLAHGANRYGTAAVLSHWTTAAAALTALPVGWAAAHAPNAAHAALLRAHVPLGMLALLLTLVRVIFWMRDVRRGRRPGAPPGQPRWQTGAAHVTHALLCAVLIAMGASGIALTALSGAAPILFSGVPGPLPRFADLPPMAAHVAGAIALAALLCVHLGAVIYHQLHRRDRILARMGLGAAREAAP